MFDGEHLDLGCGKSGFRIWGLNGLGLGRELS